MAQYVDVVIGSGEVIERTALRKMVLEDSASATKTVACHFETRALLNGTEVGARERTVITRAVPDIAADPITVDGKATTMAKVLFALREWAMAKYGEA